MFFPPGFDPSKMDPKVMMELSRLVQELPQEKLMRMQSLMHNMMAGFDVRKDMEEFERSLPPGFRERLMKIMGTGAMSAPIEAAWGAPSAPTIEAAHEITPEAETHAPSMDMREARLTVLRGVAEGRITPEDAERLLFSE